MRRTGIHLRDDGGLCPVCEEHIEEFPGEEPPVENRIIQHFDIPEAEVRLRSKIWWEI